MVILRVVARRACGACPTVAGGRTVLRLTSGGVGRVHSCIHDPVYY